jgi:hypothetical protein
MKREDIDKRIGMPDVDAEWARFEREVIGKNTKPNWQRVAAWAGGIGIAATIALLFVLNMGKGETEKQPLVAQLQPVHVESSTADTIPEEGNQSAEPAYEQSQQRQLVYNEPESRNVAEALQGHISGLDIVPSSDSSGIGNIIRLAGSVRLHRIDSFAVILNGVILEDSIARGEAYDPQLYLYKQHQIINSIKAYKDESSRARFESIYGFPPPSGGFIEIETMPDTLCDAYVSQHPELKQTRRYIEGYVLGEDDQPLADAWIACDESIMGAATDSTGHFVMWPPRTVTKLYVRHVGYQTICHTIQPADTILNFRMKDATKIKDVKVIPKRGTVSSGSAPSGIDAFSTDMPDGKYYDLQGHGIDGKPTEPGIYIVDGKKVFIK